MNRTLIVAAVAALAIAAAGCPGKTSTEMVMDAFAPDSGLDAAQVDARLQEALVKADEEIAKSPEEIEPYVTKYSILRIKGDFPKALEALHAGLDRGKPANEAETEKLKGYLITGYYRAGTPDMLQKGLRFLGDLVKAEGKKNAWCYAMGLYYRKLYQMLGDGVYKTEANRWLLGCRLEDAQVQELKSEGLMDALLE